MAETRKYAEGCDTKFTVYTGDIAEVRPAALGKRRSMKGPASRGNDITSIRRLAGTSGAKRQHSQLRQSHECEGNRERRPSDTRTKEYVCRRTACPIPEMLPD